MRAVAAVVVVALLSSWAVFDRCLINCHEPAADTSAQEPACHHAETSSDDMLWQGTSACGHDHDTVVQGDEPLARLSTPERTACAVGTVASVPVVARVRLAGVASHARDRLAQRAVPLDLPLRL